MAKTFNVDRQKGGSYEFSLDANGNYTLNSVGFNQLKTLNLPELKKETAATTTTSATTQPIDIKTASAQTKKAFGDVQPFYYDKKDEGGGGGGQYTSEYEMKKEGDLATDQAMTKGDNFAQARQAITSDAAYRGVTPSNRQPGFEVANKGIARQDSIKATDQIGRQNVDQVLDARAQTDRFGTGQRGPKPSKGMPITPSDRQPGFEIANTRVTPQKPTLVQTALRKVNTGLQPLAKAIGFVMNPIGGAIEMVAGAIKETPTNKHDKAYFNVNENGRIAGNASTDLFAGMNRVSARGNLSQAGLNRISKRNSAKTQANLSKLSPERKAAFNAKTKEMEKQHNDYEQSRGATATKSAKAKGLDVKNPNEMRSAGGGSGGGGKTRVICTELHSTGEMSTRDWLRDIKFTYKDLSKEHIKGYLLWAVPTVEHIQKYPRYRKIWKHIAQHRANDIAWRLNQGKFDLLGRIYAGIGEPLCWLIGKCISDKQIKELELNNWRKT